MPPLLLPPEVLGGMDITVQEINLRQILTAVRRRFLAPNEVRGHVTERAGSVIAAVDWPRAPAPADGGPALKRFLAPSRVDAQGVAAFVACSISWARAASQDKNFAAFSRGQFCDFVSALGDLYALEAAASSATGLDDDQTKLVRARAVALRSHYGASAVLPNLYRLRADLLDLLPEDKRRTGELVEAQEDRLRYAMLSPELSKLPEEERRMAALALARPAIPLKAGEPQGAGENWSGLLDRHLAEIAAAAAATGLVVLGDGKPTASAFIVAPGVVMTAGYVLDAAGQRPPGAEATSAKPPRPRLCLGPSAGDCGDWLEIGDVLYDGKPDGFNAVLAEIPKHDPALHPPIPLADALPEPNAMVGSYAYVIGYAFSDPRMPPEFMRWLLGDQAGLKRLMPGRILAFGTSARIGQPTQRVFTSDISTSSGTGGGPLLDMLTGKVIGMSYAGVWQGGRGKFAYSEPIPAAALELIGKRLRGEVDEEPEAEPKEEPQP